MDKPFQRKGAPSNTRVGSDFEAKARAFFSSQGLNLRRNVSVRIGVNGTKPHVFDLGNDGQSVLVECKSHTWTEGKNVPSAKMTSWNQAMYFFLAAPSGYRKILFVLRHFNSARRQTLAEYYVRTNSHLIPQDVEVWEYDEERETAVPVEIHRSDSGGWPTATGRRTDHVCCTRPKVERTRA